MSITVTLDSAGRVLIPKAWRDELNIEAGDTLEMASESGQLTLRPMRAASPLRKVRGVWTFRCGSKLSAADTDKALSDLLEQRDKGNRGRD